MELTQKELKLVDLYDQICNLNPGYLLAITGSLSLRIMGMKLRREVNDLDIVVIIGSCLELKMPVGFFVADEHLVDYPFFRYSNGEILVDVLRNNNREVFLKSEKGTICSMRDTLSVKLDYVYKDANEDSRLKHYLDLIYIFKNNYLNFEKNLL